MLEIGSALFSSIPFEDAIKLFMAWGFQVEPGSRPDEVTLIMDALDYPTYTVLPADLFAQVAAVTLRIRWCNGAMFSVAGKQRKEKAKGLDLTTIPSPFRTWPVQAD